MCLLPKDDLRTSGLQRESLKTYCLLYLKSNHPYQIDKLEWEGNWRRMRLVEWSVREVNRVGEDGYANSVFAVTMVK